MGKGAHEQRGNGGGQRCELEGVEGGDDKNWKGHLGTRKHEESARYMNAVDVKSSGHRNSRRRGLAYTYRNIMCDVIHSLGSHLRCCWAGPMCGRTEVPRSGTCRSGSAQGAAGGEARCRRPAEPAHTPAVAWAGRCGPGMHTTGQRCLEQVIAGAVCHTWFLKQNWMHNYMNVRIKFHIYSDLIME